MRASVLYGVHHVTKHTLIHKLSSARCAPIATLESDQEAQYEQTSCVRSLGPPEPSLEATGSHCRSVSRCP